MTPGPRRQPPARRARRCHVVGRQRPLDTARADADAALDQHVVRVEPLERSRKQWTSSVRCDGSTSR